MHSALSSCVCLYVFVIFLLAILLFVSSFYFLFFLFFFVLLFFFFFFFSSRRRHTRLTCDWSSDVCSSDLLLDLLDGLLAEVRDRGQLGLALGDQVADRLDADPLQAVVGADAELELLDQDVLHPVGARRGRLDCGAVRAQGQVGGVDVGEDRQVADEDLGRVLDRIL